MDKSLIETLLTPTFSAKHIGPALDHFAEMIIEFQNNEWEHSIAKAGKFVEAILKGLFVHVGQTPPRSRKFKADPIIHHLGQLPDGSFDDTVRLTIPRAARFVYDIASNRGEHDTTPMRSTRIKWTPML